MTTISAFSLIKNANIYAYPIVESIYSALNLVDEYVVNVASNSQDDTLLMMHKEFDNNPKVKMFESVWEDFTKGTAFFSNQTNKALERCKSNWCLYIQADEAISEFDYNKILEAISYAETNNKKAIVFDYLHFEKNYNKLRKTYNEGFDCYEDEIRLFKNDGTIVSFGDAQSFCYKDRYAFPLRKIESDLYFSHIPIYHYGYVKSPKAMLEKKKALNEYYFNEAHFTEEQKQKELAKIKNAKEEYEFSYQLNDFTGTHPKSMAARIEKFNREYPELLKD